MSILRERGILFEFIVAKAVPTGHDLALCQLRRNAIGLLNPSFQLSFHSRQKHLRSCLTASEARSPNSTIAVIIRAFRPITGESGDARTGSPPKEAPTLINRDTI
jgi:hypothetical protein